MKQTKETLDKKQIHSAFSLSFHQNEKSLKVKEKKHRTNSLTATKGFHYQSPLLSCPCRDNLTLYCINISHLWTVKCHLTIFHIGNDCDSSCGELWAQTAPHGHAQGDIETFLVFIQRVIDDHNPAGFLHLSLVKAQDAVMVLRPGDVIRVGQHCGGDGACSWNWGGRK